MSGGEGLFGRLADRLAADEPAPATASSSPAPAAFGVADLLELPDAERTVLRQVMRHGNRTTRQALADELAGRVEDLDATLAGLVERRALVVEGGHVEVASMSRRTTPGGIWDRLGGL